MEDTMMRKNHASLTAALVACAMMLNTAGSWADDAPQPGPDTESVASVPAPVTTAPPVPVHLAWDRVGISAYGIGV
jgi:hypothetical protein